MDLQLDGRVIFIAGASQGIGLGIAEACLAEGARVAITARGAEKLEAVRARLAATYGEDRIWAATGDLRVTEVIDATVDEVERSFGPIWGAVANVGVFRTVPGFDVPDELWEGSLLQNLTSAYRLARRVLRPMTERNAGSLLFISSIAGIEPVGTPIAYGSAKAGMIHLAKELSKLAAAQGVRVNTIAPGYTAFEGGNLGNELASPRAAQVHAMVERNIPLKRLGTVEDMGAAATFLLSPVAGFITGALLPVDGGHTHSRAAAASTMRLVHYRCSKFIG